ncbi:MAG: hypothetical protein ACK40H_04140 [Sphingomonadaceae bacterium]
MEIWVTGAVLAGGLALAWGAARADRRPRLGTGSLMPWPALMLMGATAALFAAVHLVTLLGRGGG